MADVDAYKEFLPYCLDSRVLGPSSPRATQAEPEAAKVVDAELVIGFSALRESYVSEVFMRPHEWVKVRATRGSDAAGQSQAIPPFQGTGNSLVFPDFAESASYPDASNGGHIYSCLCLLQPHVCCYCGASVPKALVEHD